MSTAHSPRFSIKGIREHEESHHPTSGINVGEVERWASAIGGTLLVSHGLKRGSFGGLPDKFPLGAAFSKGLTFKMGQTHVHRYLKPLLEHVQKGDIDPSFVITHRMKLDDAPLGYSTFHGDQEECIKVVLKP